MQWYWIDIVIIGVIALSVLTGLARGLVKELIAICVWVLAIWVAYRYSELINPWFEHYIQDKTAKSVVSFIVVMIGILIAGGIANAMLGFILKRTGLGGTDRLLGMAFGFIRGIFIVALVMTVVKMTSLPYETYYKESKLYAKFDPLVDWLYGLTSNMLHQAKQLDKLQSFTEVSFNIENKQL